MPAALCRREHGVNRRPSAQRLARSGQSDDRSGRAFPTGRGLGQRKDRTGSADRNGLRRSRSDPNAKSRPGSISGSGAHSPLVRLSASAPSGHDSPRWLRSVPPPRKVQAKPYELRNRFSGNTPSNSVRVGLGFRLSFTTVDPWSLQSRVLCLIHLRRPPSAVFSGPASQNNRCLYLQTPGNRPPPRPCP
jgi:hypothetical protein